MGEIDSVMLVDDDLGDQLLHKRLLGRTLAPARLIACSSAEEALGHLRAPGYEPVDLLLLDIKMPKLSGFDFLDRAIATAGHGFARSVAMLSASKNSADLLRTARYPIVRHYFAKPLRTEDIATIVARLDVN